MSKPLCVFFGLIALGAGAHAGTIGASAVSPSSVPAGVATAITFTSVITDAGVIPSTVNLQQVDSAGRATAIGTLHDDGQNGDATAGDGTYSFRLTLFQQAAGTFTYRVSAGFQGSLTRALSAPIALTVSGTGTAITLVTPAPSAYLNISPTLVTGTVGDPRATVSVNGVAAQVSGNNFSASIPLQEGSNTITAVAMNSGGTAGTASETVTLDTTPPHVTIDTPSNNSMTIDTAVNVAGIVNDIVVGTVNPLQATVTVNGLSAQVANRTFIAANVPLQMGPNTITATARDRAGNFATTSVTVTRQAATVSSLRIVSGNNATGPIKTSLPAPLVVQALNAAGQPIVTTPVVFRVARGDGTVSTSSNPGPPATRVAPGLGPG